MRLRSWLFVLAAVTPVRLAAQERPQGPLARELAPLMQTRTWRNAQWGAMVVSLTYGDTLFSWRADTHFTPASNAKLFTTAAALHYLTPDYRFLTVLYGDGPIRAGTLLGDLVLYGTGDPTFALDTAALAPFADSVVRAGIHAIRGDVVGDASFLGAELTGPGWSPDELGAAYAAPPSALGAAENNIRIIVRPGAAVGKPARIEVEPANDYYSVQSVVVTSRRHTRTRISISRGRSRGVIQIVGNINIASRGWSDGVAVEEPAVFAASLLRQLLVARGVTVQGVTRSVTDAAPERAQRMLDRAALGNDPFSGALAVRRSATLDRIITMINHRSHNLSAELALRTIGRMVEHAGTYASGARAVQRFLTSDVGIASSAFQITDGSGLSVLDEATPRSLVQLLAFMQRAPESDAFVTSLPMAGDDGTVRRRMRNTEAVGRVRAKTGTLSDVSALSGYVRTDGGEDLAFSIIVNDAPSIWRARQVQDQIGVKLSMLSRPAPVAARVRTTGATVPPQDCCR